MEFKSSLFIVHTNSLSDRCFANILSQSVACLLIFLTLLFFKNIYFYLFIFGYAGSPLFYGGFSLIATNGGCSPVVVHRLFTAVTSLVAEHGL